MRKNECRLYSAEEEELIPSYGQSQTIDSIFRSISVPLPANLDRNETKWWGVVARKENWLSNWSAVGDRKRHLLHRQVNRRPRNTNTKTNTNKRAPFECV